MTRTQVSLGLAGLFLLGLWGCSESSVSADRAKQMETRIAKLEEDLKGTVAGRDVLKKRVTALEEQVRAETERAKLIEQERDTLTAQLRAKVAEKDTVVTQYDDLVKKLETLLGQARVTQAKLQDGSAGKVQATVTSMPK